MGKVRFTQMPYVMNSYGYYCDTDGDNSGCYYPAADYEAIEAKLETLAKGIRFIKKEWNKGSYGYEWFLEQEEVKAAIDAAKSCVQF